MKNLIKKMVLLAIILVSAINVYSKILMSPYLQAVTPRSIYIMVETDSKESVTVEYGVSDNLGLKAKSTIISKTDAKPATYIHKVKLERLNPATRFFYRAVDGDSKSELSFFRTAIQDSEKFRFAIMGDCRSDTTKHSEIARRIMTFKPVFSVYGGDLCYNSKYTTWKDEFFIPDELKLDASVPFFNAIGNHEGWTQNTMAFLQAPESNSGKQEYYSFDYGDIHFLVLSTQHKCKKGTPQYDFIIDDLSKTDKKFKIVCFHESAYCEGGHGENKMMKAVSQELFEKYKVDVVITGHSHFYQHNLVAGIHHLTVAGGGAPLYTPGKASYTVKSAKKYHFGIADYVDGKLTIIIYAHNGEVIDTIEIKK